MIKESTMGPTNPILILKAPIVGCWDLGLEAWGSGSKALHYTTGHSKSHRCREDGTFTGTVSFFGVWLVAECTAG